MEEKSTKLDPVERTHGSKTDKYSWSQTLSEVTVTIPLPSGTRAKDLETKITGTDFSIALKGKSTIVSGKFKKSIKPSETDWQLEDGNLIVYLHKFGKQEWWSCVLDGEPEIDTTKIQPEATSNLSDLDGETRGVVEKMMFDQRQKQMGLPSSEEQEMMKKLFEKNPELKDKFAQK
jgi:hypothetical protein